jgi:hypothetical protein
MIGSDGLGGPRSWPVEYGGRSFIRWAIENLVADVIMVDEHRLDRDEVEIEYYGTAGKGDGK